MARSRTVKPSFFDNEILAECTYEARLLFIGLWTLADREGRLEDRPKKIKKCLFGYDGDIVIENPLKQLHNKGFIIRYSVDGSNYIWIPKFKEHQNPHKNETDSNIPPYSGNVSSESGNGTNTSGFPENAVIGNRDQIIGNRDQIIGIKTEKSIEGFEAFWKLYPRKLKKRTALKCWETRIKEGASPKDIISATENYAKVKKAEGTEMKHISHPSTFLGPQKLYEDYIDLENAKKFNTGRLNSIEDIAKKDPHQILFDYFAPEGGSDEPRN